MSEKPNRTPSHLQTCAIALGLTFVITIVCFGASYLLLAWEDLSANHATWLAQNQINGIYERVKNIKIQDSHLLEESNPETGRGGTLGCVYGRAKQVYSARMDYPFILDAYRQAFDNLGWVSHTISLEDDNQEGTAFFPSDDGNLIVWIQPMETSSVSNPTKYAVYLDFNECCPFCDEWRRNITRPHWASE